MTKATKMQQPDSEVKLTPQQEAFCNEFIKDLNIKQAAIRAGYSEKHAANNAYTLNERPCDCSSDCRAEVRTNKTY